MSYMNLAGADGSYSNSPPVSVGSYANLGPVASGILPTLPPAGPVPTLPGTLPKVTITEGPVRTIAPSGLIRQGTLPPSGFVAGSVASMGPSLALPPSRVTAADPDVPAGPPDADEGAEAASQVPSERFEDRGFREEPRMDSGYETFPQQPAPVVPRAAAKDEDYTKWHNVRHFIAYMFTLTAFTILAAPTIISIQLGMDVDAAFWIGRWGLCALFVPIFLLGQHFYHLWMLSDQRRRRRYLFIIVPVMPAVLFMMIGGTYMSMSRHLYGQLKAEDCSAHSPTPAKFWMQEAYDEARGAYDVCIDRLVKENEGHPLRRHPNLQSCAEWEELLENEKGVVPWKGYRVSPGTLRQHNPSNDHRYQYLANVEVNHLCGGFCTPGPALFVNYEKIGRKGGSCAQFVAFRFLSIMHWGIVVFSIGVIILVLSIPSYIFSRSFLTNMGYKSAVTLG